MIKTALNLVYGLLAALVSSGIVLGAISLSLVEGTDLNATTLEDQTTLSNPAQENTFQESPSAANEDYCIVPAGWTPYTIQAGDTLDSLAATYGSEAEVLKTTNCLPGEQLFPGAQLHLPPDAEIPEPPAN